MTGAGRQEWGRGGEVAAGGEGRGGEGEGDVNGTLRGRCAHAHRPCCDRVSGKVILGAPVSPTLPEEMLLLLGEFFKGVDYLLGGIASAVRVLMARPTRVSARLHLGADGLEAHDPGVAGLDGLGPLGRGAQHDDELPDAGGGDLLLEAAGVGWRTDATSLIWSERTIGGYPLWDGIIVNSIVNPFVPARTVCSDPCRSSALRPAR